MPKLSSLADLDSADLQELKEAVCDAVLERTRRVVSGEGEHGAVILGDKPSRVLSSGFVLPRLSPDGDDESNDIRIAAHGLDMRLKVRCRGALRVQPRFAVYVRAIPSADELFFRGGRLIPPADFSPDAKRALREEVKNRLAASRGENDSVQVRMELRDRIWREVMEELGVRVPAGANVSALGGDDEEAPDARQDIRNRLRIPNSVSRDYEVPQKWIRIAVVPESLELELPIDPERWSTIAEGYRARLQEAIRAAVRAWLSSDNGTLWGWRPGRVPSEAFWSREAWEGFLTTVRARALEPSRLVPDIDVQVLVDARRDTIDPEIASVRIAFENLRDRDGSDIEIGAFSVRLDVSVTDDALVPMRLERVRRSYHLAGFLSMPAVGVNGGVEDRGVSGGDRSLHTTWMPRYVLPRPRTFAISSLPTAYAQLKDSRLDIDSLAALGNEMTRWAAAVEHDTVLSWPEEAATPAEEDAQRAHLEKDLHAWRREAARIHKAIDLLRRSQSAWRAQPDNEGALPYRAWLLLNQTYAAANPRNEGSAEPGWRLFQLGFVLAHIPTLASRLATFAADFDAGFDEDAASLLYMATGGGKTEAFFGTIVYALFLDRLRGKARGVTAMMHYPLRLLTIQQAQRLARLLAQAELIRRDEGIDGAPFEVGFWVGSGNTPNRTQEGRALSQELKCIPQIDNRPMLDEEDILATDKAYRAARDMWNKLPSCPFCGSPTGLRILAEQRFRLGICCSGDGQCRWTSAHVDDTGSTPALPFLLVDSDIYRRAPSVLLGTVDKLALLGQSPHTINRIAGMFGLARHIDRAPHGLLDSPEKDPDEVPADCDVVKPSWADGQEVFFDPLPSLVVQDEMHLLDESLGTFGGVFETALFAWFRELGKLLGELACRVPGVPDQIRLPHVIGATATAADVAKHVGALYQKQVVQFPHPGPSLLGGFYVRLEKFAPGSEAHHERTAPTESAQVHPREREAAAPWGRVYASLMTNGRLHTATTLSVLAARAATITRWLHDLASTDQSRKERAGQEIQDNISTARWEERRRSAVARCIAGRRYDQLAALVDLQRIDLTYVTNKKGGDQILSAIRPVVDEAHESMGADYVLDDYRMELISGGVDVKGIQSVVTSAEAEFDPMHDDVSRALRGIVATSAISHGVDVETFNAMIFAGMPSDIAEYIQASSRVGRLHVGFSLLLPTPQTRRDRFVVSVHEAFHRLLERMIAPPAIERWADKALKRTIPSLVQMWLVGVHYQRMFVSASRGAKGKVRFPNTVEAVDAVFKGAGGPSSFDDCVDFVQAAVGIGAGVGGPGGAADYYRHLVREAIEDVRREICGGNFTGGLNDFWNNDQNPLRTLRPMTSLRDVDEAGTIQASRFSLKNKAVNEAELAATMAFLRNRGVSRGRLAAQSETDGES